MSDRSVEGGCLCGAVRYRVTDQPRSSSICHCPSCRRASGAPSVAWFVVRLDRFELLSGELAEFHSSAPVVREFCRHCGSQIAYRHQDSPGLIELTTATLDDPEVFPPTREIWLSHRLSWEVTDPQRKQDPEESHT
jgi:hypothetical protein